MKKGTLYCVGMGPGDPELLTFKAWHALCHCPVLALPEDQSGRQTAAAILKEAAARQDGMHMEEKTMLSLTFPMTRDAAVLQKAHEDVSQETAAILEQGLDIALITLGCPTVYASCMYIQKEICRRGYDTVVIPGITSFSAVAARLGQSLCEKDEPLLIVPAGRDDIPDLLDVQGSKVLMKVPRHMGALKEQLQEKGLLSHASLVERCGLPGERVCTDIRDVDDTGYFSVILVRQEDDL